MRRGCGYRQFGYFVQDQPVRPCASDQGHSGRAWRAGRVGVIPALSTRTLVYAGSALHRLRRAERYFRAWRSRWRAGSAWACPGSTGVAPSSSWCRSAPAGGSVRV